MFYYFVGRNYNSRYTWRQISGRRLSRPSPGEFSIIPDAGSDLVGSSCSPVCPYVRPLTFSAVFLVGAVLSAILGGVIR